MKKETFSGEGYGSFDAEKSKEVKRPMYSNT